MLKWQSYWGKYGETFQAWVYDWSTACRARVFHSDPDDVASPWSLHIERDGIDLWGSHHPTLAEAFAQAEQFERDHS